MIQGKLSGSSTIFKYQGSRLTTLHIRRRTRKRIDTSLDAKIILSGQSYDGVIGNLSENGIKWYLYGKVMNFIHGDRLKIKFRTPSGQLIDMYCKIKWLNKKEERPSGAMDIDAPPSYTEVGLEIIESVQKYKEFFETIGGSDKA
ncbi:MAG TPA: PilZ domain-containing protein [Nitrospirae bacterium]|nr:PilZ domain-containing protein [Nitrospirota bacterium]HDO25931.1 PilZ domain-containing protein [Nitrospirota bacterium]